MADDWQVGDLALCVSKRHWAYRDEATSLVVGRIYTVAVIGRPQRIINGERALGLSQTQPRRKNHGWPETMFRKIRPHEPDAEDVETIRLLNGVPVPEPAQ